jgi:hypothetical protein
LRPSRPHRLAQTTHTMLRNVFHSWLP